MPAAVMMAGTYFNPRSSCEERQLCVLTATWGIISIHAPHARSDDALVASVQELKEFQSTLLMRGATPGTGLHAACELISIHAPHARSDVVWSKTAEIVGISIHAPHARSDESCSSSIVSDSDFNPRSSCEERQTSSYWLVNLAVFQSTLLMRGATDASCRHDGRNIFQSTLLMRGATALRINSNVGHYFNPRSSCEERRCPRRVSAGTQRISIHAPHARSDSPDCRTNPV